jgi:hypothetical protein
MGVMDSRASLKGIRLLFLKNACMGLRAMNFRVKVDLVPKIPFRGPYEAHAMGARAVNARLTKEQRQASARKAVAARWAKRKLAA